MEFFYRIAEQAWFTAVSALQQPIVSLIYLAVAYFLGRSIYSFFRNYTAARNIGLHHIISPVTPYTLSWQLTASLARPLLCKFQWFRAIDWTCAWRDGSSIHKELGECFIVVSSGLNVLCTSDPKTVEYVLRQWREFVKPDNVNEILGTFGQNVDTSNGDDWPRHRKLTAPCFSERASSSVWSEATQRSELLIQQWLSSTNRETNNIINDTSTLALNVISAVAFENHQVNEPTEGHALSLRDALTTVMSTSISPALESVMPWLKTSILSMLLPKQAKQLLSATREFRQYMDDIITRERTKNCNTADTKRNLISTLIKANSAADSETKARLSAEELRGNIFIFTVGGLESTSITLSYAMALLAVHPEVQSWVAEEVSDIMDQGENEYKTVFPKLKRCMAVMYETLRTHGPSPPLPRSYVDPALSFKVPTANGFITLPPSTQIMLNSWACHASSSHFPDPKSWNPKRWVDDTDNLIHPTPGSGFFAWGSGPRVCPGMKFSQVEFCAVLASVLKSVRVGLVVDNEEIEWEKEKARVLGVLQDSVAEPLLLHVKRPEELWLKIEER